VLTQVDTRQNSPVATPRRSLTWRKFIVIQFLSIGLYLTVNSGSLEAEGVRTNQVRFRAPQSVEYRVEEQVPQKGMTKVQEDWIRAWPEDGSTNFVELGARIVLQLKSVQDLKRLIENRPLKIASTIHSNVFMLEAPDATTAAREAHRMAGLPSVLVSHPVARRLADLHGPYASLPTDSLFYLQWQLEHRQANGSSAGADLNVRAAWPLSTGEGVTVAVADTGIEMNHPELSAGVAGQPHYSFLAQNTNGSPVDRLSVGAHGTEVSGLIAADLDHARMVGVAPGAKLASWVVVNTNQLLASDELLMEMYQYQSNLVGVENFSWGHAGLAQNPISLLEQIGISNAVTYGRSGRGIVMVRSAGNDRLAGGNANDDGYRADSRVITVGAVRIDGRAASYSDPGACLLVAAPSGDTDTNPTGLFTTDLLGSDGVNVFGFFPPNEDLSGYVFNSLAFSGTSAAAPQISGLAALLLSVNPELTYRDVQQILIVASRHFDFADPDLQTNGAGLLVSHNVGFGVPDAGVAVNLAAHWTNRPPMTVITLISTNPATIAGDGLRVLVSGPGVPSSLASIQGLPSTGPQPDTPTALLPLADFGFGTTTNGYEIAGKGALIQRGTNTFAAKINLAAQAGAAFAIVYNFLTNSSGSGAPGGEQLFPMAATDFVPIPAVFIGHNEGIGLVNLVSTNNNTVAQISMGSTRFTFPVTNTLICEHINVRLSISYPNRGDLRVTLLSPSGTRSVLQSYNSDTTSGPTDWTYSSTHHFFESTAGDWTVYVSNQGADGFTGLVQSVTLSIEGVPIVDADRDGLDDQWELEYFGSLNSGARDDPDGDGYSNALEQLLGTDPTRDNHIPFKVDLSPWNSSLARLSWPASPGNVYEVWGGGNPSSLSLITNLPGAFPLTEWFVPTLNAAQFFRINAVKPQ
jgi:subtilisin family serine protease/subtilisin-like proprotein convertase family protein